MQQIKNKIISALQKETKLKKEQIESLLETPPSQDLGDLSFPCFSLAKLYKKNPAEISQDISSKLKNIPNIEKVESKGPYINFFYNKQDLSSTILKQVIKDKNYGKPKTKKQTVMIEYSSPNTNKPLHLGHLRNDSLGMSLNNILQFIGNKTIKTEVINDRGIHICKSMLAYKKWGKNKTPLSSKMKPDHFVGSFYVLFEKKLKQNPSLEDEIQEMLEKWESNDISVRALWKKMNSWVIKGMEETYKTFNSKFDLKTYESQIYNKATNSIEKGKKSKIFQRNEKGDLTAQLEPDLPNKVVLRANGTSVYITQDLALAEYRFKKYKLNKLIYIVASEQILHFKQLFKIFQLLKHPWHKNCYHLPYGLVNLPTGRMKTREGTIVDADNLISSQIDLAKKEILSRNKSISNKELLSRSKKIALASIKYYLLKTDPIKDELFDPKKAIRFEGDTGPYIQYTITRCNSILKKSKNQNLFTYEDVNNDEKNLIKIFSEFPDVINKASLDLKPNHICNYAFNLATTFNSFYEKHRVLNENNKELESFRITITKATRSILELCLNLLNIDSLKEM
ncbi:arginine--tRNA ligase [archaeon]|nr:arginine--tRNA ligase [archaeon]|tara:strand:+ start:727 stop:2427 length:1701 start_codon:yes stop_codon:yes gene_type:complete